MSTVKTRFSDQIATNLNNLVGRTGVVGGTLKLPGSDGDGRISICAASTGNLAAALDGVRASTLGASTWGGTIDGAGGAFDPKEARLLSIAEGLERYASCVYDENSSFGQQPGSWGRRLLTSINSHPCRKLRLSTHLFGLSRILMRR